MQQTASHFQRSERQAAGEHERRRQQQVDIGNVGSRQNRDHQPHVRKQGSRTEQDRTQDAVQVFEPRVTPSAAVHAEQPERGNLQCDDDTDARLERLHVCRRSPALELQPICSVVRSRDEQDVEQHLRQAPLVEQLGDQHSHGLRTGRRVWVTHLQAPEVRGEHAHGREERRPEHEAQGQVQPHQGEADAATECGERVQQERDLSLVQA